MPSPLDPLPLGPVPTAARPLAGMTVLVVEDSRFASEAVRLLCLRSGARIRRADSLRAAWRHLQTYMPSVVIVDLGLPDGSGLDLIRQLHEAQTRIPVILATSGDDSRFGEALEAGADNTLTKPIESLGVFQSTVLDVLPEEQRPSGLRAVPSDTVTPDRIALQDDLAHISELLTGVEDDNTLDYVTKFLSGLARSAHDKDLEEAANALASGGGIGASRRSGVARVAGLLQQRLGSREAI